MPRRFVTNPTNNTLQVLRRAEPPAQHDAQTQTDKHTHAYTHQQYNKRAKMNNKRHSRSSCICCCSVKVAVPSTTRRERALSTEPPPTPVFGTCGWAFRRYPLLLVRVAAPRSGVAVVQPQRCLECRGSTEPPRYLHSLRAAACARCQTPQALADTQVEGTGASGFCI